MSEYGVPTGPVSEAELVLVLVCKVGGVCLCGVGVACVGGAVVIVDPHPTSAIVDTTTVEMVLVMNVRTISPLLSVMCVRELAGET